jgi:hypothetical protein
MPGPKLKAPSPIPVTKPADVELGMKIREVISGVVGTAWSRRETLAGSIQFALQPVGDGKTLPESYNFDWQTLEIIDSGVAHLASPEDPTVKVKPGDKVKDPISGMTGVAIEKYTYMNGCVKIMVQGKDTAEGKIRIDIVDHAILEILDKPRFVPPAVKEQAPEQKEKPTGGPITRAYRP